MAKMSFIQRLYNAIKDYGAFICMVLSAAIVVYGILADTVSLGLITTQWVWPTGLVLFLLFLCIAFMQYRNKERRVQNKDEAIAQPMIPSRSDELAQQVPHLKAERDVIQGNQTNNITNFPPSQSQKEFVSASENRNKQLQNETVLKKKEEISGLMKTAIEDAGWLFIRARIGEIDFKKRLTQAFQSGANFHEYFNRNEYYFSEDVRKLLKKLDLIIHTVIQLARTGSTVGEYPWSKIEEIWKESPILEKEIINKFHEEFTK